MVKKLCAAVWLLTAALLLFLPVPQAVPRGETGIPVLWENGGRTSENYAALSEMYEDCTEAGLTVSKNGIRGTVFVGETFSNYYRLLSEGRIADLYGGMDLPAEHERMALFRKFGGTGYYSEEFFALNGDGFYRSDRRGFSEVMLLTGDIPASVLRSTGAEKLIVCPEAELTGYALFGTRIKEFGAFAPYEVRAGALCLHTAGGTRLVAALPLAETLEISGDLHFCDEGALSSCERLRVLTLPFVGSSVSPAGSDYDGRLLYMFGEGLPRTLKKVKVTGGALLAFAFEGCAGIEEIDLCGIPASAVSKDAFVGCYGLKKLHTSLKDLHLQGKYRVKTLPCGCCLYEQEEE